MNSFSPACNVLAAMGRRIFTSVLFGLTIFVGAFLLFQVQPLIGKYILPWFGGTPAVWTTCMLFFQIMLLVGYAYAHGSVRFLSPRMQTIVHITLLALAVGLLPIIPSERWATSDSGQPILRILGLLTICVGAPYVVLASTGPLLQAWYGQVRPGESPYRLYALSNFASLLALVSYPFFFEPRFTRIFQAQMWGWTLIAFALLCAATAIVTLLYAGSEVLRRPGSFDESVSLQEEIRPFGVPQGRRLKAHILLWVLLPACASALLLGVTNKICQDVAVVPLLWVLPLAIYLLTFIICFDNPRWYLRAIFMPLMALSIAALCWALFQTSETAGWLTQVAIYSLALFACCMVCHGELYALRPPTQQLTLYYLLIAAGGAIGGIAVAIVAPMTLNGLYELHLTILATALLALWMLRLHHIIRGAIAWIACAVGMIALACVLWIDAFSIVHIRDATNVRRTRNFYGVLTIYDMNWESDIDRYRVLRHGAIAHGFEFMNPALRRKPTSYYGPESGVGLTLLNAPRPSGAIHVGVIGLGAGTVLAYAHPGDQYTIYEINPEVVRIAQNDFAFIHDCPGQTQIVLGDARLSLGRADQQSQQFDVLILDAFSGDAIPVHLLTKECFELYLHHLRPGGIIAVHISNRYLDLAPVVVKLAEHFNLSYAQIFTVPSEFGEYMARWMLVTSDRSWLDSPPIRSATLPVAGDFNNLRLWTDDDTNLFQILN